MTQKIKSNLIKFLMVCLIASVLFVNYFLTVNANGQEFYTYVSHGVNSMNLSKNNKDEYIASSKIVYNETKFLLNKRLPIDGETSFDFKVKVKAEPSFNPTDAGSEMTRGMFFVINEVPFVNGLPNFDSVTRTNTKNLTNPTGYQIGLHLTGNNKNNALLYSIMSNGMRTEDGCWTAESDGTHLPNNYYLDNIGMDSGIKVTEALLSNRSVRITLSSDEDNYIFSMQAYKYENNVKLDSFDGNKVDLKISKQIVNPNGGEFKTMPYLSFFSMNYAGESYSSLDYDIAISKFDTGKVENVEFDNPTYVLKENLALSPKITLIEGTNLSDVVVEYKSLDTSKILVDNLGNVTKAAGVTAGSAMVKVSANGFSSVCRIDIYESNAPIINFPDNMPETAKQYEQTSFPIITATDDSGNSTMEVRVISPYVQTLKYASRKYLFIPTKSGEFTIEFRAIDNIGNETIETHKIKVEKAEENEDWQFTNTNNSFGALSTTKTSASVKGMVGTPTSLTDERNVLVNKNPITFNKGNKLEFDLSVKYDLGKVANEAMAAHTSHSTRGLVISLNEAQKNTDGSFNSSEFSRKNGIQLMFGKGSVWPADWTTGLYYQISTGSRILDANPTYLIEESPSEHPVYDFKAGDANDMAIKFNAGGKIHFVIERLTHVDGDFYIYQIDKLKLKIPANLITSDGKDFQSQAFLGISMFSQDGIINTDYKIENIKNGNIKNIKFNEGSGTDNVKVGNMLELTPEFIYYNGDVSDKNVTWLSTNPKIAEVVNGKVTIYSVGKAFIRAVSSEGKYAEYVVDVMPDKIEVPNKNITVKVFDEIILSATTNPLGGENFEWTSSNSEVAVILRGGKLQALKPGTATITVSYKGLLETIEVTVEEFSKIEEQKNCSNEKTASISFVLIVLFFGIRKIK